MAIIIPIIPIHNSNYCHRQMNQHEEKVMLGCFIIVSIIWAVITIIMLYNWFSRNKNHYFHSGFLEYYYTNYIVIGIFNGVVSVVYGLLILIWLGSLIANFI